jgi:hypothetical protein
VCCYRDQHAKICAPKIAHSGGTRRNARETIGHRRALPDRAKRQRRKAISTNCGQDGGIERRIPFEAPVNVVAEIMVPGDLVEQLENCTGAETVNLLDVPLSAKARLRLPF